MGRKKQDFGRKKDKEKELDGNQIEVSSLILMII
jgi:hypothetical protein